MPPPLPQPPHPVHALTSSELARYQRDLEHAITAAAPGSPARAGLRRQLDQARAEQRSRAAIAASLGRAHP